MKDKPSFETEVGGKPNTRGQRRHERPSLFNTKFRDMEGYEFWITPYNRIFLVEASGGNLTHPRLSGVGDRVILDPAWENVPATVLEALRQLLERQEAIRTKMVQDGEYDEEGLHANGQEGWE